MPYHQIGVGPAASSAKRVGMFARVSADDKYLVYYTGNEDEPGTWLEAGRTMIGGNDGPPETRSPYVARAAHKLITGEG